MTRRMMAICSGAALAVLTSAALADQSPESASAMGGRNFKAVIQEAVQHAYEADAAGSQGDAEGLKKHAHKAMDKAKEGQRAGHNERLNDGVYALGEAIEHAEKNVKDATEHIKRAIMKLSQSAGLQMPEGSQAADAKRSRQGASSGPTASRSGRQAAYSGGYFDDGFADDDWFYDFYDVQFSKEPSSGAETDMTRRTKAYQAEQLYENAQASGLFEF